MLQARCRSRLHNARPHACVVHIYVNLYLFNALRDNTAHNACENVSNQIEKRTRVVDLLRSEESPLRLVTGVLIEVPKTWENGKVYLTSQLTEKPKPH